LTGRKTTYLFSFSSSSSSSSSSFNHHHHRRSRRRPPPPPPPPHRRRHSSSSSSSSDYYNPAHGQLHAVFKAVTSIFAGRVLVSKELILAEDIVSRNSLHTAAHGNNLNSALVFLLESLLGRTQPRTRRHATLVVFSAPGPQIAVHDICFLTSM